MGRVQAAAYENSYVFFPCVAKAFHYFAAEREIEKAPVISRIE
jgi:hypothetical protein